MNKVRRRQAETSVNPLITKCNRYVNYYKLPKRSEPLEVLPPEKFINENLFRTNQSP